MRFGLLTTGLEFPPLVSERHHPAVSLLPPFLPESGIKVMLSFELGSISLDNLYFENSVELNGSG